MLGTHAVLGHLLRNEVRLRDAHLFFKRVPGDVDHLHGAHARAQEGGGERREGTEKVGIENKNVYIKKRKQNKTSMGELHVPAEPAN